LLSRMFYGFERLWQDKTYTDVTLQVRESISSSTSSVEVLPENRSDHATNNIRAAKSFNPLSSTAAIDTDTLPDTAIDYPLTIEASYTPTPYSDKDEAQPQSLPADGNIRGRFKRARSDTPLSHSSQDTASTPSSQDPPSTPSSQDPPLTPSSEKNHGKRRKISDSTRDMSSRQDAIEIKAHRCVLLMHSDYLQKMLKYNMGHHKDKKNHIKTAAKEDLDEKPKDNENQENQDTGEEDTHNYQNLVINVEHGQAECVRNLVYSFYVPSWLDSINLEVLLGLCIMAEQFLSFHVVSYCVERVQKTTIDSTAECCNLLDKIACYQCKSSSTQLSELLQSLKRKCTEHLCRLVCPLERRLDQHSTFYGFKYYHLRCMLESGASICLSECSLLTFLIKWAERNRHAVNPDELAGLLYLIRVHFLTIDFLYHTVEMKNSVLFKLMGDKYINWYNDAVCFLGMNGLKGLPLMRKEFQKQVMIDRSYTQKYDSTLTANCPWLVRMVRSESTEQRVQQLSDDGTQVPKQDVIVFTAAEDMGVLVFKGQRITPVFVFHRIAENSVPSSYDNVLMYELYVQLHSTGVIGTCSINIAPLPGDRGYDRHKLCITSKFSMAYLRSLTLRFTSKHEVHNIKLGTASQEYLDLASHAGLFASMFVMTSEEEARVSRLGIQNAQLPCPFCPDQQANLQPVSTGVRRCSNCNRFQSLVNTCHFDIGLDYHLK